MFVSLRRNVKPRGRLSVDWAHPLSRGLQFAAVFNDFVGPDLVRGYRGSVSNNPVLSTVAENGYGCGVDFPNGGAARIMFSDTVADTPYTGDLSIVYRGVIRTGSAFRQFAQKTASGGATNCPFDFRTDNSATPTLSLVRSNVGGGLDVYAAGPSVTLGKVQSYGCTASGSNGTNGLFYLDGVKTDSGTASANAPYSGSNSPIWIGRRQDGAVQMDGVCLHCYIWNRILTPTEMLWIAKEPYAFVSQERSFRTLMMHNTTPPVTAAIRRTLAPIGTRIGTRQTHGWAQ